MEIKINPKNLFSFKRLDLVVKYLYAREILENDINIYQQDIYKDLYIRHIAMRTMGEEPDKSKQNIDEYLTSFRKLIDSIRQNGFSPNTPPPPIQVSPDKLLADGAHRIASSLALGRDVYVREVDKGYLWDFDWFCHNGFNTEDKQRILKGFVDIHPKKCAIFVVWNPLFAYLDNVKAILSRYFDTVGEVELDFEDNYIAFTNSLLEIYERNIAQSNGDESGILAKAQLLSANHLSYKVIVVTNQEKNSDKPIGQLSKSAKNDIRILFDHLLPKEVFCTIHSSDSESECVYLANILLSPNNIKHLKMRHKVSCSANFINRINSTKQFVRESLGINIDEICVIRSGVLVALGILEDADIDFIIDDKYRKKFGYGDISLDNKDCDIASLINFLVVENSVIYNAENHFYVKGLKFANLDIVKQQKKLLKKKNDAYHLRLIDLFEKMIGNINQRIILTERIEIEKDRRLGVPTHKPNFLANILSKVYPNKRHYE